MIPMATASMEKAQIEVIIQSRWAMSYLRGPLTKQEIRNLKLGVGSSKFEVGEWNLEAEGKGQEVRDAVQSSVGSPQPAGDCVT